MALLLYSYIYTDVSIVGASCVTTVGILETQDWINKTGLCLWYFNEEFQDKFAHTSDHVVERKDMIYSSRTHFIRDRGKSFSVQQTNVVQISLRYLLTAFWIESMIFGSQECALKDHDRPII